MRRPSSHAGRVAMLDRSASGLMDHDGEVPAGERGAYRAAASFAFKQSQNIFRQRIVKIVGNDEIALCETEGTLSRTFGERANLGDRQILLEQNDGLTLQHTMKIRVRILLDFLDGGVHIAIVTNKGACRFSGGASRKRPVQASAGRER